MRPLRPEVHHSIVFQLQCNTQRGGVRCGIYIFERSKPLPLCSLGVNLDLASLLKVYPVNMLLSANTEVLLLACHV